MVWKLYGSLAELELVSSLQNNSISIQWKMFEFDKFIKQALETFPHYRFYFFPVAI